MTGTERRQCSICGALTVVFKGPVFTHVEVFCTWTGQVSWACPNAYPFLIVISANTQHLSSGYLFFPLKWLINYPIPGRSNASGDPWYLDKNAARGHPWDVDAGGPGRPTCLGPGPPLAGARDGV
jgi:hypothetical protein